jgi:hypothetical protein
LRDGFEIKHHIDDLCFARREAHNFEEWLQAFLFYLQVVRAGRHVRKFVMSIRIGSRYQGLGIGQRFVQFEAHTFERLGLRLLVGERHRAANDSGGRLCWAFIGGLR